VHLQGAFQARHLSVPLEGATYVDPEDDVTEAIGRLAAGSFDQAPVIQAGRPIGFVLTRALARAGSSRVREVMVPLGSGNIVSSHATVGDLLEWIVEPGFLFVLEGRGITGFITVTDFNKQPARGYLYLLLARLEMGLAELVRKHYPRQRRVLGHLAEAARREVWGPYSGDVRAGRESEILAYLDFSDLICIVRGDEHLRSIVSGRSRNAWADQAGGLVELRHQVMHPVRNVVLAKDGLVQLRNRVRRLQELIDRVEATLVTHSEGGLGSRDRLSPATPLAATVELDFSHPAEHVSENGRERRSEA
jgi:hypothetical protein